MELGLQPISASITPLHFIAFVLLTTTLPSPAHDRRANAAIHQNIVVRIAPTHVEVTFHLENNEEATTIEAIAMDTDADGKLSPVEQSSYFAQLDARLRENLQISIGDRDIPLSSVGNVDLSPPARKTFHFRGDIIPGLDDSNALAVHNDNFLDWPGRASLVVETSKELAIAFSHQSATDALGELTTMTDLGAPRVRQTVDWNHWSWPRRLLDPLVFKMVATVLLVIACGIILRNRSSISCRVLAGVLLAGSLSAAGFAFFKPKPASIPDYIWQREFRAFHDKLSSALAQYHHSGDTSSLAPLAAPDAVPKLTNAARLAKPDDDNAGTFELRHVRPISTDIQEAPKSVLSPTLRVRHEWRAIGLMRHSGHPHERMRTFTCDYTFRVTDRGLQLLDCSNWRQLPDEPISN